MKDASWIVDCNICTCTSAGISCTDKVCTCDYRGKKSYSYEISPRISKNIGKYYGAKQHRQTIKSYSANRFCMCWTVRFFMDAPQWVTGFNFKISEEPAILRAY